MRWTLFFACVIGATSFAAATLPLGCDAEAAPPADPTYRDDVATILDAKCARCHAGAAPAAGFRTDSYRGAIGCTATGAPAVLPHDAAPLLAALDRPDHRDLVTAGERATLAAWVATGAQGVHPGVHPPSFADPRSPSSHGGVLRAARYRQLLDVEDRDACARCHDGAGARPKGITSAAPGATPCTTCHGAPGRPFPPRDACFFPNEAKADAHAAHAAPSRSRADGIDCAACHPRPALGAFDGAHGDGHVEVWFDARVAGREARFDASGDAKRCTGTCHDRGGSRPAPTWTSGEPPLDCQSCHTSPPPAHFSGPCSGCHREANATGTALASPRLHVNGKVDLGDGSGRCGACHGTGDSPWPTTGAHAAHAMPAGATPVACETCHELPGPQDAHPIRAGAAKVRLAGLATNGGSPASYDPATQTCAATYCHAGAGAAVSSPRWTDGASARTCGSCHATPPPAPHTQATACGASTCHDGITGPGLTISASGRAVHVDGRIDRHAP
jgi:predicted CxxxxCH...CXXCH cytochrome family protein